MKIILLILLLFFMTAPTSVLPPNGMQDEPNNEKEVELFNGEDLTGWHGNMEYWRAENGRIVGEFPEPPASRVLYLQQVVGDFRVILNVRTGEGKVNSGIQFRDEARPN